MGNKANCAISISSLVEPALRSCCTNYEEGTEIRRQELIKKDKVIKAQELRIKKLEKVILNNLKNGENFIK